MGDDLNSTQFDFDEEAYVATSTAAELSGEGSEDGELAEQEEAADAAKLKKKEVKKRKFQEMKEKKKKKLKTDLEADPEDEDVGLSAEESYEMLRSAIRATRYGESVIPEDMVFMPKIVNKTDPKIASCPFFSAIQTKLSNFHSLKKTAGADVGSPLVIIISSGAVRSVEIMKVLSRFSSCRIAKLFAKHFKVEEQVDMLREYHPIAVGTPNRLNKLVDIGALTLSNTKLILIDMATDEKSFTLLNSPNVKEDFFKFLIEHVVPHSADIKCALVK